MRKASGKKKRTGRKRTVYRGIIYILLSVALVGGALWLSGSLFFRINRIQVQGTSRYGESAVIAVSGISEGDSPFFVDKAKTQKSILETFPYVSDVELVHQLPGTIVIQISERKALGLVEQGTCYWLMDGSGRLLEQVSGRTLAQMGIPVVRGLTFIKPAAGEDAAVPEGQVDRWKAALSLLQKLEWYGILSDVSQVDVARTHQLTLTYDDERFLVLLGDVGNLDIKLPFLLSAVKEIRQGVSGVMDVSRTVEQKAASFLPDTAPNPVS